MTITGYFMDSPPEYNAVLPVIYYKILPSGPAEVPPVPRHLSFGIPGRLSPARGNTIEIRPLTDDGIILPHGRL